MKKVQEWRSSTLTRDMATQMILFIEARLELLKIYEMIANTGATVAQAESSESVKPLDQCLMPIDEVMVPKISVLVKKFKDCLTHDQLSPLKDLFHWELDALQGIFACLHHLNHWRYMEALIEIDRSKKALTAWLHSLQTLKWTLYKLVTEFYSS